MYTSIENPNYPVGLFNLYLVLRINGDEMVGNENELITIWYKMEIIQYLLQLVL